MSEYVILTADAAQIEARFSAWLANEQTLLAEFAADLDPYGLLGASVFGLQPLPKKEFQQLHPVERFIGKTGILGLGYQAGAKKFFRMVHASSKVQLGRTLSFTMEQAEKTVFTYRTRYSGMPALWRHLQLRGLPALAGEGAELVVGPFRVARGAITGPGGLRLIYPGLKHDLATGEWTYQMGKKRSKIYGGKILENITQFGSRILTMDAAVRLYHVHGIRMGLQSHDELVFRVHKDDVQRVKGVVLAEMERVPGWARALPLRAEVNYGANYGTAK